MDSPKRILIVQLQRAGDVIVTTPVAAALRQALPEASIDFLVDKPFAPLLEHNPSIDGIRIFNRQAVWATWRLLRAASYDWILDFQGSPRSIMAGLFSGAPVRAGYRVPFWGRFYTRSIRRPGGRISITEGKMSLLQDLLPHLPAAGERRIYLTAPEREWAEHQALGAPGDNKRVAIIPTSRRPSRRWPAESFVKLSRLLQAEGYSVLFFWGPGEKEYVEAIGRQVPQGQMIPPTSLRQMAALLGTCALAVTNTNGPMHLAVAAGIPTVTIYGPTDPVSWHPGGPRHRVIQAENLGCLGCNMSQCPFGHECMTGVSPEHVFSECRGLLASTAGVVR
jgi:ADP-heptose:LPS heptosyltransferase